MSWGSCGWDEDCLTLTISIPRERNGDELLPVMVWFHGGAFLTGSGFAAWYDARAFAAAGAVCVGVNYRLGALGFRCREGVSSGRMGLTDALAALKWVREHIASFGGDPEEITLYGQSAGAQLVACLLAEEETDGMFCRAILESPPLSSVPYTWDEAAEAGQEITALLERETGENPDFQTIAAEELLKVPGLYGAAHGKKRGLMLFKPVMEAGGESARFIRAVAAGAARKNASILLGANSNEMNAFSPDGLENFFYAEDEEFWLPTVQLARALRDEGIRTYLYQFGWYPLDWQRKACHCIELPFAFQNRAAWNGAPMLAGVDEKACMRLEKTVHGAWSAFIRTGRPDAETLSQPGLLWPEFRGDEQYLVFGWRQEIEGCESGCPEIAGSETEVRDVIEFMLE